METKKLQPIIAISCSKSNCFLIILCFQNRELASKEKKATLQMVSSIVEGNQKTSAYYCKKFFKKQLLFNHFVLPKPGISMKEKQSNASNGEFNS